MKYIELRDELKLTNSQLDQLLLQAGVDLNAPIYTEQQVEKIKSRMSALSTQRPQPAQNPAPKTQQPQPQAQLDQTIKWVDIDSLDLGVTSTGKAIEPKALTSLYKTVFAAWELPLNFTMSDGKIPENAVPLLKDAVNKCRQFRGSMTRMQYVEAVQAELIKKEPVQQQASEQARTDTQSEGQGNLLASLNSSVGLLLNNFEQGRQMVVNAASAYIAERSTAHSLAMDIASGLPTFQTNYDRDFQMVGAKVAASIDAMRTHGGFLPAAKE